MATITNRTVFYEMSDGYVTWSGWALVTMPSFGTLAEPFQSIDGMHQWNFTHLDWNRKDEDNMVTALENVSLDKLPTMLSGGENTPSFMGGHLMPKAGR